MVSEINSWQKLPEHKVYKRNSVAMVSTIGVAAGTIFGLVGFMGGGAYSAVTEEVKPDASIKSIHQHLFSPTSFILGSSTGIIGALLFGGLAYKDIRQEGFSLLLRELNNIFRDLNKLKTENISNDAVAQIRTGDQGYRVTIAAPKATKSDDDELIMPISNLMKLLLEAALKGINGPNHFTAETSRTGSKIKISLAPDKRNLVELISQLLNNDALRDRLLGSSFDYKSYLKQLST